MPLFMPLQSDGLSPKPRMDRRAQADNSTGWPGYETSGSVLQLDVECTIGLANQKVLDITILGMPGDRSAQCHRAVRPFAVRRDGIAVLDRITDRTRVRM